MPQVFSCISSELQEKHAKRLQKVVRQLLDQTSKSAGMDQKRPQLWTVKLNEKLRLFFTEYSSSPGAAPDLFLLHIMENHKYKLALPIAEKLRNFVIGSNQDLSQFVPYSLDESTVAVGVSDELDILDTRKPAHLFRDAIFQLSREQGNLIYSQGSFIVYGAAGTGKSSSALFLIEQLLELPPEEFGVVRKPILFLAQSPRLVDQMKRDWESFGLGSVPVIFMTTEEFYSRHIEAEINLVSYEAFQQFYIEISRNALSVFDALLRACKIPAEVKPKDKKEFVCRALYQELCLLAPWGEYEESGITHIGEKNSYFFIKESSGVKRVILDCLRDYRAKLSADNEFDTAISIFPKKINPLYSYLVIDEGQNFSLNELTWAARFSDECCLFMDDNQNTRAPKSSILLKQKLLKEIARKEIPIHPLRQSYRCSALINSVANEALSVRDDLAGISSEEVGVDAEQALGEVKFYVIDKELTEAKANAEVHSKIARYKTTEVVIITSLDKHLVQAIFPGYIICHPSEVAGLEFQCAVLYHPFGESRQNNPYVSLNQSLKEFSEKLSHKTVKGTVPHSLKHATTIDDPQYTQLLQTLYMICTRPSEALIIAQKKFDGNEALLKRWSVSFSAAQQVGVMASVSDDVAVDVEQSTEEEWKVRLFEMMLGEEKDEKQIQYLVERYLYQNVEPFLRWQQFLLELALPIKTAGAQAVTAVMSSAVANIKAVSKETAINAKKKNKKTSVDNKPVQPQERLPVPVRIESVSSLDAALDQLIAKKDNVEMYEKNRVLLLEAIKALSAPSEFSLFFNLAFIENQSTFLKLLDAGVFSVGSTIPVAALTNGWEIGEEKERSALWQLLQTESGCAILHKLINLNEHMGEIIFQKSISFLLKESNENGEWFSSFLGRIFHGDRCAVLICIVKLVTFEKLEELCFIQNLLATLEENVNDYHFPETYKVAASNEGMSFIMPYFHLLRILPSKQNEVVKLYQNFTTGVAQSAPNQGILGWFLGQPSQQSRDPKKEQIRVVREKIYSLTLLMVKKIAEKNYMDIPLGLYAFAMQVFKETQIDNVNDFQDVYVFLKKIHDECLMRPLATGVDQRWSGDLGNIYIHFIFMLSDIKDKFTGYSEMVVNSYNLFEQNRKTGCLRKVIGAAAWQVRAYNNSWAAFRNELCHSKEKSLPEISVFFERMFCFFDSHKQDNDFKRGENKKLFVNLVGVFGNCVSLFLEKESSCCWQELSAVFDWQKLLLILAADAIDFSANEDREIRDGLIGSGNALLLKLINRLEQTALLTEQELREVLDVAVQFLYIRCRNSIWIETYEHVTLTQLSASFNMLVQRFFSMLIPGEEMERVKTILSNKLINFRRLHERLGWCEPAESSFLASSNSSAMFSSARSSASASSMALKK